MPPILHNSIPVQDLVEAKEFSVHAPVCQAARGRHGQQRVAFAFEVSPHSYPEAIAHGD